jgi:hypothetical protein
MKQYRAKPSSIALAVVALTVALMVGSRVPAMIEAPLITDTVITVGSPVVAGDPPLLSVAFCNRAGRPLFVTYSRSIERADGRKTIQAALSTEIPMGCQRYEAELHDLPELVPGSYRLVWSYEYEGNWGREFHAVNESNVFEVVR